MTRKLIIRLLPVLWFALPVIGSIPKILIGPRAYNNYLIYKFVFWHSLKGQHLYAFYPDEYLYQNHYGPSFSAVIAPFAWLPDRIGILLWVIASAALLYYAIRKLPISPTGRNIVMGITLLEMAGTLQNQQINVMVTAWIILSFVFLYEQKPANAALFISTGILTKLYGIVGLAFVPFSGKYKQMTIWMILSLVALICLPMLWAGPEFILQSYADWYERLIGKNQENINTNVTDGMQDLSFMGMVRRITGWTDLSNLWFIVPAALLLALPLLRFRYFSQTRYQLAYLAQVMIGLVIFSTSAESPTYVIAVSGFAIWYAAWDGERPQWLQGLLVLMFLLTILSYSDIYPPSFRNQVIKRYALKALPCVIAWCCITWHLLRFREPIASDSSH